jgi:hypothetical protein
MEKRMSKPTPTPWASGGWDERTDGWLITANGAQLGSMFYSGGTERARLHAEFVVRAVNQYDALGKVAIAAGEYLLKTNAKNREALGKALEKLADVRSSLCERVSE